MKNLLLFTLLIALLFSFVSVPFAGEDSSDNGQHEGYETGVGHIDFPGEGKGLGHDKHECDVTCPLCGGNPCVPPCPGV